VVVGSAEKDDEVRSAGSIGAAFTVVLNLTFPEGVNVVFVLMRMFPPYVRSPCEFTSHLLLTGNALHSGDIYCYHNDS